MALRSAVLLLLLAIASPVSANLRLVRALNKSLAPPVSTARALNLRFGRHVDSDRGPELITHHPNCSCITWKDAYHLGAKCDARELHPLETESMGLRALTVDASVDDEFCNKFFHHISDNFCVNTDRVYHPQQWCYVSNDCGAGGLREHMYTGDHGTLRAKICDEGDKKLMDYSFDELYELTKKENLDVGVLAQYAWKYWRQDFWPAVESELMSDSGPSRMDLKQMVAGGKPVFFTSDSGHHPPFHLVRGSAVYEIRFSSDMAAFASGRMANVNEMVCLKGCA